MPRDSAHPVLIMEKTGPVNPEISSVCMNKVLSMRTPKDLIANF
jgi:hypothetical protein